jgi:hypothetical protein
MQRTLLTVNVFLELQHLSLNPESGAMEVKRSLELVFFIVVCSALDRD